MDADPETGRIFVGERNNGRVSEYTAWGLFVKAWGWGVADGTAGFQTCGPAEPEGAPPPSLCRAGIEGSGVGQFNHPTGIAVDADGNVYVFDRDNARVQKFGANGSFQLMFGGDVNKTKVEEGAPESQRDVCPVAPSDVCQAGTTGSGPSHFTAVPGNSLDYIAFDPATSAIVVGDLDRIQIFNLDGTFRQQIKFEGSLATFAGKPVAALDVASSGDIYFAVSGIEDVYRVTASGAPVAPGKPLESSFNAETPTSITLDSQGNLYVVDDPLGLMVKVRKYDSAGNQILPTPAEEQAGKFFPEKSLFGLELTGVMANRCAGSDPPGNLYISSLDIGKIAAIDAYGTPPIGCEPPPKRPPEIVDTHTASVGLDSATVKAQINPKFWADTTYWVEYGTTACSLGGCTSEQPPPPGSQLTSQVISAPLSTAGVLLSGLDPRTVYHYRFVSESGGGGPVFGPERTFKTFPTSPTDPDPCPVNEAVRVGLSRHLPDCRAYELVSPVDKEGRDTGMAQEERFIERNQSAPSGERFTFSSLGAFSDPESGPFISQYIADRGLGGWSSKAISPERTSPPLPLLASLSNEFKGFSEDLCQAWLQHNSISTLTGDAVPTYPNLYKRDNCAEPPSYEAISTEEPPARDADEYFQLLPRGFSEDGSHTVFTADDQLHPDAPAANTGELRLYERTGGETRFVCYLPDNTPYSQECSAGTLAGISGPDMSSLHNAVSDDGSHIFWTAYSGTTVSKLAHPGQIYVRIGGTQTVAVSGSVSSDPAFFWTAANDGSKAIFEFVDGARKGELYLFDVETETATPIAKGVEGPMGTSEDLSRVYFASSEDLDEGGPATKGGHNLYLYEADPGGGAGAHTFVMELAADDIGAFSVTVAGPARPIHRLAPGRGAAVTPDGSHATFMSTVSPTPTDYDNRDANSGKPSSEVYRYDANSGELRCVSCNPTGARPTGMSIAGSSVAARIQGWEMNFHAPQVISIDGSRVFFESSESLVSRDVNGTWDVYQWEEPGKGGAAGCSEDRVTFTEDTGGCVELISSGEDPAKSTFLDADPLGDSVFISTQASLVKADPGLNDVYVARVGGGFPERQPIEPCPDGGCQAPAPAPAQPTPSSSTYRAPAPPAGPKPRRCPKGKRKVRRGGKVRCVKKRKAGKRANRNRRAGR